MKLLFVCMLLIITVSGLRYEDKPRIFCGRALAEARFLYCFGTDVTEQMKRVSPPKSLDMLRWFSRRFLSKRTPGLVDECCLKPCYVSQLLSYC